MNNVEGTVTAPSIPAGIKVAGLKCEHLPKVELLCICPGNYYVKFFVDKDVKKTALPASGSTGSWKQRLECGARERIESLLAEGATAAALARTLRKYDDAGNMREVLTVLEFTPTSFTTSEEARDAQLNEAVSGTDRGRCCHFRHRYFQYSISDLGSPLGQGQAVYRHRG